MARRDVLKSMALRQAERAIQEWYWRTRVMDSPVIEPSPPLNYRVYALADPRNGEVFYIGKGGQWRLRDHEREAEFGMLTPKCVRIREIWRDGLKPEYRTIALCRTEGAAYRVENELIAEMAEGLTNDKPPLPWREYR